LIEHPKVFPLARPRWPSSLQTSLVSAAHNHDPTAFVNVQITQNN